MMKTKYPLSAAILFLIVACEKLDTVENMYPDAKVAINDGAVERGIIPAFLPPSAKQIKEKHNLDTNEVWLRFSMEAGELGAIEKFCERIPPEHISLPRVGGGDWWPEGLTKNESGAPPRQGESYTHYRCDESGFLAVDGDGKRAFYWRHG